ncbi:MAG: protein of unknown function DUF2842 [Rhodobacteraceae bacterium HLUCCA08]|nr:MAG: protein of unknown function DUF2842 [Rhodobacteraceae bacterium HLUCCA08]
MALSYKQRRKWALVILLVGLPIYIVLALVIVDRLYPDPLTPPPVLAQLAVYVGLGLAWALPFKFVFRGVGQAPPPDEDG